jgi:beta-glucosidase
VFEAPRRLGAFQKVDLEPGASQAVTVTIDPRLAAVFDESAHQWRIAPGTYRLSLGESSRDIRSTAEVALPGLTLPANWRPQQAAAASPPPRPERGR